LIKKLHHRGRVSLLVGIFFPIDIDAVIAFLRHESGHRRSESRAVRRFAKGRKSRVLPAPADGKDASNAVRVGWIDDGHTLRLAQIEGVVRGRNGERIADDRQVLPGYVGRPVDGATVTRQVRRTGLGVLQGVADDLIRGRGFRFTSHTTQQQDNDQHDDPLQRIPGLIFDPHLDPPHAKVHDSAFKKRFLKTQKNTARRGSGYGIFRKRDLDCLRKLNRNSRKEPQG
jgi:hypothetical protein